MTFVEQFRPKAARVFAREENDHYAEPAWVSERLFDVLQLTKGMTVLDPACGFGRIPTAAMSAGLWALGSDIVPQWKDAPVPPGVNRTPIFKVSDFFGREFTDGAWPVEQNAYWQFPDVIASNPPFKLAQEFADLALKRAVVMVALLLPTKWVQGDKRSRWLESTPLHLVMPISPRPSIPPGQVWLEGGPIGGGTVDFSWFVWLKGYRGKPMVEWLRRAAA